MKIIKNGKCYVERDDVLYLEAYPSIIYGDSKEKFIELNDYDNLDDIINYNYIKDLTDEELDDLISNYKDKLSKITEENKKIVLKYQLMTLKNYQLHRFKYDRTMNQILKEKTYEKHL